MKRLVQCLTIGAVVLIVLGTAVSAAGSGVKTSAAIPDFTSAQLSAPAGANWILENGNVQSWRYSTLNQINGSNGSSLKLAWTTHLSNPPSAEQLAQGNANPIV